MSINSILFNGLSGLNSMNGNMGVMADNIANVNTVSFKSSSMNFSDLLSQTYEGIGQTGNGSSTANISKDYDPGSFETTASSTDMAIAGLGFFILQDPADESTDIYTRDGQFKAIETTGDPDASLNLVNQDGYLVQGINTGSVENPTGTVEDITISRVSIPQATENVTVAVNLQLDLSKLETTESSLFSAWDGTNTVDGEPSPITENAYAFSTTTSIYDGNSNGVPIDLNIYFDQTTNSSEWEFLVTCDPSTDQRLIDDTTGTRYNDGPTTDNKGAGALLYGKLSFSPNGELSDMTCWTVPPDGNVDDSATNSIQLGRGEGYYSFDYNFTGTGPNLSSTLNFGTVPFPQEITSPGSALADTNGISGPLIAEQTNWSDVYDATGNQVQNGDQITITGTSGDGNVVNMTYVVDFNNTVGDFISALETQFNCDASLSRGALKLEDLEIGDSQLAISSISYLDANGNSPTTNTTLAQIFGNEGSAFQAVPGDRYHPDIVNTTSYANASVTLYQNQDGYGKGYLQDVKVQLDGTITGFYSNGRSIDQAQLVLADFVNYDGLRAASGNHFLATDLAGEITINTAGNDNLGKIAGNALEMSNVDLARQFVELITTQRAFQANSTSIKTADEVYQTTLQMLR